MRTLRLTVLSCGLFIALPAAAADATGGSEAGAEQPQPPRLPLGTGDVRAPGALVVQPAEIHLPPVGTSNSEDFMFDYHGYFRMPLSIGLNSRLDPTPEQGTTLFHAPAVVPDNVEGTWLWSNNVPNAWANVQLSYGNKYVAGIVGISAWRFSASPNNAAATGNANLSMGPVYVHVQSPGILGSKIRLDWDVGAFGNRYGYAGRYDYGAYGTFVIGATGVVGETLGLETDIGEGSTIRIEHGLGGNAYVQDSFYGSSLLHHAHAFYGYKNYFRFGVHYLTAWTTDERAQRFQAPAVGTVNDKVRYNRSDYVDLGISEGRETVIGADMRVNAGIAGSLYVGASYIKADHAETVAPVIYVMNAAGGRGLRDNFLGGDGTGSVTNILVQYDYSFGALARYLAHYPPSYWTNGPDLTLSLFGAISSISAVGYDALVSSSTNLPPNQAAAGAYSTETTAIKNPFDGTRKVKYGGELTYSPVPYLSLGFRYDQVIPWTNIQQDALNEVPSGQSFQVLSPKIKIKTSFWSREEVTIQYSRYMYGDSGPRLADAAFNGRNSLQNTAVVMQQLDPTRVTSAPYDKDLIYLSASMWW